jgi:hypothetical protein
MGLYLFCLCFGFAGLLIMAVLGHTPALGSHGRAHSHGHGGHASAPPAAGHGSHAPGHSHGAHSHDGNGASGKFSAQAWLSPRVLFSLVFAFGASGFLLGHLFAPLVVLLLSLALAWLFERWLVQPLWRVLFGFASNPARMLENALLDEAQAVTNFDRRGHGLIALDLDGQVVQVLGVLKDEDRKYGVRIRAGDRVSVVAVDTARNSCTVARLPLATTR